MKNELLIYQTGDNQVNIKFDGDAQTLWLTQKQMGTLFAKDIRTVNEHINNIYKEQELELLATIRKFRIVQKEGKRGKKRG